MAHTPGPYKPSGKKYLVIDIRDGIPNRKRFYAVEAHKLNTAFTDDIAYFKHLDDANLFSAAPRFAGGVQGSPGENNRRRGCI
jgi:hypothetical protein